MTAVPAPPPSVSIDRAGAGEGLSASTAVALPPHASRAEWQLRLELLQHLGILHAGSGVMQGQLLYPVSLACHQPAYQHFNGCSEFAQLTRFNVILSCAARDTCQFSRQCKKRCLACQLCPIFPAGRKLLDGWGGESLLL